MVKSLFQILFSLVLLSFFSCSRKYVPEPLKIPEEVKEYPDKIDKSGKDYVYRSGYFMWNGDKEKYEYVPAEWVAQKEGYRWDPGSWQKSKFGYRYRGARWRKVKQQEPARPKID